MHQSRRTFLAAGGAMLFGGPAAMKGRAVRAAATRSGIAEAFAGKFLLGSAISSEHLDNNDRRYLDLLAQTVLEERLAGEGPHELPAANR